MVKVSSAQMLTPSFPLPSGMDPRTSAEGESHTTSACVPVQRAEQGASMLSAPQLKDALTEG